jgi:predicted phage-related endonuclease
MKIVNVKQGTTQWHSWRRQCITASDAAVLVGASPYKSFWQLWAEKCDVCIPVDLSRNPNVIRGNQFEDEARRAVESQFGGKPSASKLGALTSAFTDATSELLVPVCIEHDSKPFIAASLDGVTSLGMPVEIKCPSERVFETVEQLGKQSEAAQFYEKQVQYQLLVSGANTGYLFFYSVKTSKHVLLKYDRDEALIKQLEARAEDLHNHVLSRTPPPKDPLLDPYIPEGEQATKWAWHAAKVLVVSEEIQSLKKKIAELESKQDAALEPIQELLDSEGFHKGHFAGVGLTKVIKKGAVDYNRVIEENLPNAHIDLDAYRKADSSYWRKQVDKAKSLPANFKQPHESEQGNTVLSSMGFF